MCGVERLRRALCLRRTHPYDYDEAAALGQSASLNLIAYRTERLAAERLCVNGGRPDGLKLLVQALHYYEQSARRGSGMSAYAHLQAGLVLLELIQFGDIAAPGLLGMSDAKAGDTWLDRHSRAAIRGGLPMAHYLRGEWHKRQGNRSEAFREYRLAFELQTGRGVLPPARVLLALCEVHEKGWHSQSDLAQLAQFACMQQFDRRQAVAADADHAPPDRYRCRQDLQRLRNVRNARNRGFYETDCSRCFSARGGWDAAEQGTLRPARDCPAHAELPRPAEYGGLSAEQIRRGCPYWPQQ